MDGTLLLVLIVVAAVITLLIRAHELHQALGWLHEIAIEARPWLRKKRLSRPVPSFFLFVLVGAVVGAVGGAAVWVFVARDADEPTSARGAGSASVHTTASSEARTPSAGQAPAAEREDPSGEQPPSSTPLKSPSTLAAETTAETPTAAGVAPSVPRDPEIQVSFDCSFRQLPIVTPPGSVDYVRLINKHLNSRLRGRRGFMTVETDGNAPREFPVTGRLIPPQPYVRCIVTNHSGANVIDLTIPLGIKHGTEQVADLYEAFIPLLAIEKQFIFFVVNECPTDAHVVWPRVAMGRLPNEAQPRQFDLRMPLAPARAPEATMSLPPAKVNPTGNACE
jgi:hypothetical protein